MALDYLQYLHWCSQTFEFTEVTLVLQWPNRFFTNYILTDICLSRLEANL